METKVWTFNLSDGQHTVELDHGYWSGKRIIKGMALRKALSYAG